MGAWDFISLSFWGGFLWNGFPLWSGCAVIRLFEVGGKMGWLVNYALIPFHECVYGFEWWGFFISQNCCGIWFFFSWNRSFLRSSFGWDVGFWVLLGFWRKGVSYCVILCTSVGVMPLFFGTSFYGQCLSGNENLCLSSERIYNFVTMKFCFTQCKWFEFGIWWVEFCELIVLW